MFSELKDKQRILKEISPDFEISFDMMHDEFHHYYMKNNV